MFRNFSTNWVYEFAASPSDASNTTYTCRARNDFNDLDETRDLVDIVSGNYAAAQVFDFYAST